MSTAAHVFILLLTVISLLFIVRMVRRNQLPSRYALLWLSIGAVIAVLATFPGLLDRVSSWMGIAYAPGTFFLGAITAAVPHRGPLLLGAGPARRAHPSARRGAGAAQHRRPLGLCSRPSARVGHPAATAHAPPVCEGAGSSRRKPAHERPQRRTVVGAGRRPRSSGMTTSRRAYEA